MNEIALWAERMRLLIVEKKVDKLHEWCRTKCVYGLDNFCDGRANRTAAGKRANDIKDREPCQFYVKGQCMKRLEEEMHEKI